MLVIFHPNIIFNNFRARNNDKDLHSGENCKSNDDSDDSFENQFDNDSKFSEKHEFENDEKDNNFKNSELHETATNSSKLEKYSNNEIVTQVGHILIGI